MNFEWDETQVAVRELARKLVELEGVSASAGVAGPGREDGVAAGGTERQGGGGVAAQVQAAAPGEAAVTGVVAAAGVVARTARLGAVDALAERQNRRAGSAQAVAGLAGTARSAWERLWGRLRDAELLSLAVPERLGGSGLGVLEVAVLLTELGRGGVVSPGLAHLASGVLPVARLGTPGQQDLLLAGDGLTAAVGRVEVAWGQHGLTGTAMGVPFAEWARWGLVVARLGDGGSGVAVVDLRGAGVEVVPTPSSSGAAEATVRFGGAEPVGLLGEDRSGRAVTELRRCAAVGACAFGEGLLAGALALTVAHVGQRRQFGRVLAEFQAVAMRVADVRIAGRTVEVVNRAAAWGLGAGVADRGDVEVAAHWVRAELVGALESCHHLHGGLGLDVSYPLHRYSALGRDLVRFLGVVRAD